MKKISKGGIDTPESILDLLKERLILLLISLTDCIEGSSMFFLYGKVGMTI